MKKSQIESKMMNIGRLSAKVTSNYFYKTHYKKSFWFWHTEIVLNELCCFSFVRWYSHGEMSICEFRDIDIDILYL